MQKCAYIATSSNAQIWQIREAAENFQHSCTVCEHITAELVPSSLYSLYTVGRVKDEKSQLGITAICFFGTILYGETEFTALLMIGIDWGVQKIGWKYG
jgi:hypothetical protein